MPIYKVNGDIYNIPEEKQQAFEKKYPDALVSYTNGNDEYEIPVAKRDAFVNKFPDATLKAYSDPAIDNQQAFEGVQHPSIAPNLAAVNQPATQPVQTPEVPMFDDEPQVQEQPQAERGFAAGARESWKGLKAGFQNLWGETANIFTGSSQDSMNALNELNDMVRQGKDVAAETEDAWTDFGRELRTGTMEFLPGWMVKGWKDRVADKAEKQKVLSDIRDVLGETGGDVDKARALLEQRVQDKSYGDLQKEKAAEKFADIKPTEGFGAWVGSNAVQMIPSASALIVGAVTKSPAAAKAIGMIGMGGMTASTAGTSMYEAREAGASDSKTWKVGVTDGMIEYLTEKLPFDRYTSRIMGKVKGEVAQDLFSTLRTNKATRTELENLLVKANERLGGKLFSKKNLADYIADMMAEGASEFSAEALQTMTSMMYEEPENYPTINEILTNGWEGAKAGFFMGAVLGGASKTMEHSQNRQRRMDKGSVDIALVDMGNGEKDVAEVVEYDAKSNTAVILRDGAFESVSGSAISDGYRFSFDEFEKARLRQMEDEAIVSGNVNDGQIQGLEDNISRDIEEIRALAPEMTENEISSILQSEMAVDPDTPLGDAVAKYQEDVARHDELVAAKRAADAAKKEAIRTEIETAVGQRFWVQESGEDDGTGMVPVSETVEEVVYADGRVGYVVGSDESGNLTMVYTDGTKGFSSRAEVTEKENSGEILSNTVMGLDDYLAVKMDIEEVTREKARMQEEHALSVEEMVANHPQGSVINVGTEEAKIKVPIIAPPTTDGVIVQMPDGTTPMLTWEDVSHAEKKEITPKTDAQINQSIVDEYRVAYTPVNSIEAAVPTQQKEEQVKMTSPANPLPLKADGTVDQTALWNKDPERWAQWNDEQRQDGGVNSLAYVSAAIAKEQAKIAELQAAYAAESDFDARDAIEKEIADTQARVERLTAIQQGYVAQTEAAAAAAPVAETQPGSTLTARMASEMTQQELNDLDESYDIILSQTRVPEEKARLLQEYLDRIAEGSTPIKVLTRDNYEDVMRAAGCPEADIAAVGVAMANLPKGQAIAGFASGGKIFAMADSMPTIEEARITYVHERQHLINSADRVSLPRMVSLLGTHERALEVLKLFVEEDGVLEYKHKTIVGLADEIIARCMEIAYTTEEFSVDLQSKGLSDSVISIIEEINNGQRNNKSLSAARRSAYAGISQQGNNKEESGDSGQVSGGVLGEQRYRSSRLSQEGTGDGSTGEGAEVISEEQLNAPNSGTAQQITAADGEVLADTDGKGGVRFSIRTWNEGGRDYLAAWLANDTTLTEEEKADIIARMDEFYKNALLYSDTYAPFGTWSDAGVRYDNNGNPLMSVIKANGDYAMNLDFSLVCKKRRPLNRLLRTLVNRNAFATYTLRERELAEINWILQEHGFEVACALCFVDSKRYRVTGVADVFAALYNRLVKSLAPEGVQIAHFNYNENPNVEVVENGLDTMSDDQLNWDRFDRMLSAYKPGSVEHKVAQYLREHPEARKLVDATDFIEAEGFESVKENNPDLLKFYNMKKGTGGPKASFGDVQYLNDILKKEKSFDAEKAYAVGGVRLQSFSDFVPHMYFDYMQLFAELAAKKLPLHAYTKEVLFAKIFGLTGAKINMSLVPAVVEDGIAPGLDAEGNYAWADPVTDAEGNVIQQGQSFPYDEAMAIQQAEGYSKNCGVIAVGISDAHIEKMLDDPNIPFIIPYHKSSLNAIVARMTNIDKYKDYTNVQNTRKASGSKLDKGTKDFNFNEYLHGLGESGTPQQAAQAYLDWCRENNYKPKFSQFAYHPNYYKLLQDFNTIDLATGEYAPQGAVTMTFPTEESAFGNVETLIQQGLQEDAELEEKMEQEIDGIADQVLARLEEISKEPKMSEKQQAKKMAELADERTTKIKAKAKGPIDLIEEAKKAVAREERLAFRVISQENYEMAERMIDNLAGRSYFQRLEGEYELGKLASNYAELADIIMAIDANKAYTPVGTSILGFFAENPDMHFPLLFNDSAASKETANAFAEELSKVNDPYALFFMRDAWRIHKTSLEQAGLGVKASSTTKYNKAIDARAEEIKAAEVKGTAFNFKKQESSLDEIDAIFKQLNKDPELALLHDKVMGVARKLGVKVSFAGKRGQTAGESLGDKVSYDYKFFNSPAVADQKKCNTITHELIHSITVYAIYLENQAPTALTDGMLEAVGILRDVYNQIARDPAFKGEYGVSDVYEMVAELSNAQFRDKLKEKNLFQRILDALKRLLGIDTVKEDSAYQVLSDTLDYIIENYDEAAFDAYALYASKNRSYGRMMIQEESLVPGHKKGQPMLSDAEQDKAYMDAVEAGDMEAAQGMVYDAARAAGYNSPRLYHGTDAEFTTFDKEFNDPGSEGFFFTNSEEMAASYGKNIKQVYLHVEDPYVIEGNGRNWNQLHTDIFSVIPEIEDQIRVHEIAMKSFLDRGKITQEQYDHFREKYYDKVNFIKDESKDSIFDIIKKYIYRWQIRNFKSMLNVERTRDFEWFLQQLDSDVNIIFKDITDFGPNSADFYIARDVAHDVYVTTNPKNIKSADAVTYDDEGKVIPLSERFNPEDEDIRFRVANDNQAIFVSNAAKAVEGIKQEKATPEQWLKMIEKNGGLKAGEDKWMGLSDWLKASDKKTLTKAEVLDFINENMIVIEEQHYGEIDEEAATNALVKENALRLVDGLTLEDLQEQIDEHAESASRYDEEYDNPDFNLDVWLMNIMIDEYGHDFSMFYSIEDGYVDYAEMDWWDSLPSDVALEGVDGVRAINETRENYTTRGLTNLHEIALTIPTIESWGESDMVHFGDAGGGRAVAWIRFGETQIYDESAVESARRAVDEASERERAILDKRGKAESEEEYRNFYPALEEAIKAREEAVWAWSRAKDNAVRKKVLVIDEIQSKRHQEGREKGYKSDFKNSKEAQRLKAEVDRVTARLMELVNDKRENEERELTELARLDIALDNATSIAEYDAILEEQEKIRTHRENREAEELAVRAERRELAYLLDKQIDRDAVSAISAVPDAPFDKNWHELAMKRMLRYAAENGYDVVAWTTGDQQADRYDLSRDVKKISASKPTKDGERIVNIYYRDEYNDYKNLVVDKEGKVVQGDYSGNALADVIGKEMALQIMNAEESTEFKGEGLKIGGEGMRGFYDKMLPAFMNKYGKKWGVKVEDIDLPNLGKSGRTMHSVPVTEEMKVSVMEGQVMFRTIPITQEVQDEMDAISATAIVRGNYLKAPNGADTNLTPEQWAMVRTKNFKNWFGDWENDPENASKVVDENGEPKVVFHGSNWRPILEEPGKATFKMRSGLMGRGAYFTDNFTNAADYAREKYEWENYKEVDEDFVSDNGYITEAFLNIRNEDNIREYYGETYYLATDPSQIKSATDNTGEFSAEDKDIRFRTKSDVNTNPTEAQKKAGNYKMGHIRLDGYNITIENPKGSVRRGTDSKGNAWENTLNNDYGYIRGTEGVDGDHIDVYLSDNPTEGNVFVIDQVNPETREFDEHKVMYGFNSAEEAREAYLANFSEGWNGLGNITEVSKDEFKKWIESSHRKTKPFSEYKSVRANEMQATDESELRYRVVSDQETLDRLNSEPTIKVYRAMQLIDGKLYPPMSAKVDGELRQPIELGQWEEAEERPDLVDEKGRFKLDKGNKSSLKARYNPYFHTSPTPLNDQFSSAQTRPELVTVEVEVPESELTSGYKAEKAKDSVGKMEWKAGVVQSKLSGTRTVILSRWDKPVRIVPDSEVADVIVDMFEGRDITMPSNVVTPSLRAELEKRGVPFVETDNQGNPVEEVSFRVTGTPTDEVVANGLQLTPAQTAEVAANIFAALPEESRKKITEGLNGNILGLKDAILQIPTSLASKENWNDEDKQMADVVAEEMTKMAGEMTRPFSSEEGLWLLYNNLNKGTDLISQASRALVQRNLGFDAETLAKQEQAKEGVRFRTVGDANSNAQASLYNRGAVNVWTRLKESFVDMQASVEELVKAIEKRTDKVAQGFENILLALNQQSSKGLAAMESYTQKFLNPMFDEIRRIMDETKMKYEDVVRYVILKHGLERNKKLAQRDARAHYQEIYDDIISKITGMTAAQKRTYLTNAQLKEGDAKAELATLQAVDMSAMTDEEKREHKKKLAAARKAVEEAEEHLKRAQKIASLSEQEAQDELDKIFEKIENGTDSVFKEMRENDYSGISSMFYDQLGVDRKNFSTEEQYQAALMEAKKDRYSSLKDIEAAAEVEVKSFEGKTDTKELWKRINAATKETLRQQYEANMISKDQYLNLRDMFEYYVPLRGFKDNTAEDMYTYYRKPNSTGYTKPILGAEGRKTEAESPFGWIAAMAGSAIASNVKNEAKLALYYFVSNRPENGIATISKTWFVDSGEVDERGKKIFKPAYPPFSEDLSSAEGKAQYEIWQANMKELQKKGQAYEAGQRLNLGNAVVNISDANKPEHIVNVKVGGKDYTIIINGNPRAAQAINGDLNIEGTAQDYSALFGPVLRWMSSVNTSYNPEFWITNMMRDMAFTMMAVNIKEDPAYRRKFKKNYLKAFKVISLVAKNEKGTIGDSYLEQQYKDFVKYGGVTGYTQIKDSETWEQEIENYLSSTDPESLKSGKVMRGMKSAFHAAHRFGESLEQVSRFAAFLTARETGKSINEAIDDAKEITVNFNRKGSGKMITLEEAKYLTGKNGQPLTKPQQWMVVGLSSIAPLGRRFIMFFNAAIQGLNATYKLMKKNPKRFTGWALGYAAVGMMNAVLHAMMDDDDDYLDIPQYERRNSLMIGGNGAYFKWALPQEARAFYALGDLAVETVMGRNPHQNVLGEALKIGTEILPVNPSEGWKAFMPSVAIPFIELALNEDYKGAPIYNEQKWLSEEEKERTAKWSSAYQGTGWTYVKIAQGLNFITGGDKHDAGLINLQPEKLEHLVQSAFGGTIRTADKFINTISAALDPEEPMTIRQTPFLNRFLTINDERFKNVHVNDVFDYYKADAEHALTLEKQYIKDRDMDSLTELRSSDEYQWAKIYGKYKKPLKAIQDKIKVADGTAEKKELMKQQDELKKRMIKEISEL